MPDLARKERCGLPVACPSQPTRMGAPRMPLSPAMAAATASLSSSGFGEWIATTEPTSGSAAIIAATSASRCPSPCGRTSGLPPCQRGGRDRCSIGQAASGISASRPPRRRAESVAIWPVARPLDTTAIRSASAPLRSEETRTRDSVSAAARSSARSATRSTPARRSAASITASAPPSASRAALPGRIATTGRVRAVALAAEMNCRRFLIRRRSSSTALVAASRASQSSAPAKP